MKPPARTYTTARHVRVLDEDTDTLHDRRKFLQALTAQGLAIPGAYLLTSKDARAHVSGEFYGDQTQAARKAAALAGRRRIMRDFSDPLLELVRLLREASEVE